jgi:hypothetical protein
LANVTGAITSAALSIYMPSFLGYVNDSSSAIAPDNLTSSGDLRPDNAFRDIRLAVDPTGVTFFTFLRTEVR